jgi:hypothetical protein
MGLEFCYKIMWFTLQGISLLLGGLSFVALFLSFFIPEHGALAFVWLLGASVIALGLPPLEPQPSRSRPPPTKARQFLTKISRRSSVIRRLSGFARW